MNANPIYIFELAKSNYDVYELIIGKEVEHKVFGKGIITKVEKNLTRQKCKYIYIKFDEEKRFSEDVHYFLSKIKLDEKEIDYIKENFDNSYINTRRYTNSCFEHLYNNYNNNISKSRGMLKELEEKVDRNISSKYLKDDNYSHYINYNNISNENFENIYRVNDKEKKEIKKYIQERNINEIIHFTQLENLESIMKNGLLAVDILKRKDIKFNRNDFNRFDNLENTICVSIGFPNYKMFYKLRDEDTSKKWVIISLKPEILYEKTCVFCNGNAASHSINSMSIRERTSSKALKSLFYTHIDVSLGITRENLKIRKNHTSNPQAEVLVFNKIEPNYIKGLIFSNEDKELCKLYTGKYKGVKVVSNNYYYNARNDYKYWGGYYGKTTSLCTE